MVVEGSKAEPVVDLEEVLVGVSALDLDVVLVVDLV